MFFIIARAPRPDVAVWPGRRWLASLDAIAWPALTVCLAVNSSFSAGLVGTVVTSLAALLLLRRLARAWLCNESYRFATLAWVRWAGALLGLGALLKLAAVWM